MTSEFESKMLAVENLLDDLGLRAIVLRRNSSFAWATCGAPGYVNTASTDGVGTLVIKHGERHLFTTNIEAPRLANEEGLEQQGWTIHANNWWEAADLSEVLSGAVGSDMPLDGAVDVSSAISRMRSILTPEEQERFRALGRICGDAMESAIMRVKPGMTENEIAAMLGEETQMRGAQPIVNLIATDERIYAFRHPLPTAKRLDKYAMLVLCGRMKGLVASVTRLVHFGPITSELRTKANAVAVIDATMHSATVPGATIADVFTAAQSVYAQTGFENEWKLHHQGGPAGYEAREVIATPGMPYVVAAGQTYAWNPSITGCKSENTILVSESGFEVLTTTPSLPTMTLDVNGILRTQPDILIA